MRTREDAEKILSLIEAMRPHNPALAAAQTLEVIAHIALDIRDQLTELTQRK